MDAVQESLFGKFPRFVGNPNQFCVFDRASFDLFVDANNGSADCYSRISWIGQDGSLMLDKVFLDLDGNVPDSSFTDFELVEKLRSDASFRETVLGDVVDDVRSVVELASDESIPLIGVYTGKGVHLHLFFEPRRYPKKELVSQQSWIVDECNLKTFDQQVLGDVKRLCRVPNCLRYDSVLGRDTGLYTVPFTSNELGSITAEKLVRQSDSPRTIEMPGESRPPFFEKNTSSEITSEEMEIREVGQTVSVPDNLDAWLEDVVQMPCVYERLMSRNPAHYVRMQGAILLFNAGLSVEDVTMVYSQLNWADFDRKVTKKQLKHIYRKGYSSFSCGTMQEKGLCVYEQGTRESNCDVFGYSGGDMFWR